jgi:hypothetical protein
MRMKLNGNGRWRNLTFKDLRKMAEQTNDRLHTQMHDRPYVVLGAASAAGFAAGALFGSRFAQLGMALALGFVGRGILDGSELDVELMNALRGRRAGADGDSTRTHS